MVAEREAKKKRRERREFILLRTVAGKEDIVAFVIEDKVKELLKAGQDPGIYSIVVPADIKGYIVVEAKNIHTVVELVKGFSYVKGRVPGVLKLKEIEKMVRTKPFIELIKPGDIVEIISGPFRGMHARVTDVNRVRQEITLEILDAAFPLELKVPVEQIRPVKSKG